MDKRLPSEITTYQQARDWLYDRIDYERIRLNEQTKPFQLERLRRLLSLIGSPQERIPVVHIAGTKGKGSTAAMLDSILRHSGIRTGLFTSPHIQVFEERMRVNGLMPSRDRITQLVARLCAVLGASADVVDRQPTFFEATTLLGWMLFDDQKVDLLVLETGLGGRLDCTNVCEPLVTIITSIGLDHTHILGDTLELIAAEKAGILKSNVPLIEGRLPPAASDVVTRKADALGVSHLKFGRDFQSHPESTAMAGDGVRLTGSSAAVFRYADDGCQLSNLRIPLIGVHQVHNAGLALKAARLLQHRFPSISEQSIRAGLAETHWPLRFEVFDGSPAIILDAAHNPDAVTALVRTLDQWRPASTQAVLVFASSSDKDVKAMLQLIVPYFDSVILTRYVSNPRSIPPQQLLSHCRELMNVDFDRISVADEPTVALDAARRACGPGGLICVTGSLFLAAEVRSLICEADAPFGSF